MSGTFAAGDAAFNKTVAIQKSLTGAAANLLGAKVVVKMAIDNPAYVPIWMNLYSQGTNQSRGAVGKVNSTLTAFNNTFAEFVWDVADMNDFENKQFCAASATNIGIMLQTGAAVTTAGTVNVYIKSIEIRPAGYVPQGFGGGAGDLDGTAGRTNTAGTAGRPATTRSNH